MTINREDGWTPMRPNCNSRERVGALRVDTHGVARAFRDHAARCTDVARSRGSAVRCFFGWRGLCPHTPFRWSRSDPA